MRTGRQRPGQRRRAASVLLGMLLAGSALAAPGISAQEPIELEMWSWNNEGAYPLVHEDAIVRFEAANPGVTVKRGQSNCGDACGVTYMGYTDYLTRFKAATAADEPPCIAQIPWAGEFRDYVNSGELVPLTEAITTGFPAFFDPIVDAVSIGGDVWALPLDVNTLQIAYNKTKFDELGIGVPQTQGELQAAVDRLADEGLFGIAMGTKDKWSAGDLFFAQVAYTDGTNSTLAQADAGETGWDDPAFAQAADNVAAMVASGIFAPGANSMDAFIGNLDLFASGAAAMMYPVGNFVTAGVAAKVGDAFEWSLFPFPKPDDSTMDNRATGGIAEMFVVTQDCAHPEEAIEFLRYLVNDEGGAALVANDFIPSWDYPVPADKSDLYNNMVTAQATANSRVIYTTQVYAELLNAMQGIMDGSPGSTVIEAMVAAGAR
ncbi:extracellular solute-binding protein [soil metagenome]